MNYRVFVISNDGQGMVQNLEDWNGEDILELHLNAFARDAVISIERDTRPTEATSSNQPE